MTHGDCSKCKCPACRKPIQEPLGGERPMSSTGILEGLIRCPHCQCQLRYWAQWAVVVDLEKESRVV